MRFRADISPQKMLMRRSLVLAWITPTTNWCLHEWAISLPTRALMHLLLVLVDNLKALNSTWLIIMHLPNMVLMR